METRLGPFLRGMDNVSPETGLSHEAVRDAVNVDFDREGNVLRRRGIGAPLLVTDSAGSIFESAAGICYVQDGIALHEATLDGSTLTLVRQVATLNSADLLSFDNLRDGVVYANRTTLGFVAADGVSRNLGVETPGGLGVALTGTGGLDAGRYGVGITYLAGSEESAIGALVFRELAQGDGLQLTLPTPGEGIVTSINVYLTQPDGDIPFLWTNLPIMASAAVGRAAPGRLCQTMNMARMQPGNIVRNWRGHLLVARGNVVQISESMRFGLCTPTTGFVQEARRITLLEPVSGGVFVGTSAGVFFYGGESPKAWTRRITDGAPPIAFTGAQVPDRELGGESGALVAMWLSRSGFVTGKADGSLAQVQAARIRLTADVGQLAVCNRKAVAVVS